MKYQPSIPEIMVVCAVHELAELLKATLKCVDILCGDALEVNLERREIRVNV
jgi:hypothetical protein